MTLERLLFCGGKIPELNHLLDCLSNFYIQSCSSMNNLCSVAQKEGANLHLLSRENSARSSWQFSWWWYPQALKHFPMCCVHRVPLRKWWDVRVPLGLRISQETTFFLHGDLFLQKSRISASQLFYHLQASPSPSIHYPSDTWHLPLQNSFIAFSPVPL